MELKADTVYEHDEYGSVLVLGVHRVFETYHTAAEDGQLDTVLVQYAREWDEYGPTTSATRTAPIDEFTASVGEPLQTKDA